MERYIGLDVHAQSSTLVVMSPSGKKLACHVLETTADALVGCLERIRGKLYVCMEEGTQSTWLAEVLAPHVEDLVVTVPRKRERGSKSDEDDAWALAEMLRRGSIEVRVFKTPRPFTGLREAVRSYEMLSRDMVRVKNRLKNQFRSRGLNGTGEDLYREETRKAWIAKLPESHRETALLLGQELDGLLVLKERSVARVHEEARQHPMVARLATAPGLGPLRAAQIVGIVVTPHRFRSRRQYWSYCGLGIVTQSSGDWIRVDKRWVRVKVAQTRGLNRNRHPTLKSIYKSAALLVATHMLNHPLARDYQRQLDAGTKPNLALLTLARRLAGATLAMWKQEATYDQNYHRREIAG